MIVSHKFVVNVIVHKKLRAINSENAVFLNFGVGSFQMCFFNGVLEYWAQLLELSWWQWQWERRGSQEDAGKV